MRIPAQRTRHMRPLKNELLVEAWDRGSRQNPLGRALTMLAASTQRSAGDIVALSIPERDLELLRIRRMTFGDAMRGFLPCDSCGASLEFETRVSWLLSRLEAVRSGSDATWQTGNLRFSMRPVNSGDVAAALAESEPRTARRTLLERCTTAHRIDATREEPEPLDLEFDREFEQTAIQKFEEIHQGAEVVFTLLCPSCGKHQKAELDIAQFFWAEVRSAAIALLRDVHELARAYGWSEAAILTMHDARRKAYLEMVRS